MRIGVQTNPRRRLAAELEQAAGEKFDFAEIVLAAPHAALESTDWREVATQVMALNLPIHCQSAAYLPIANSSPLVRQAALDELRRSVDATARIGARLLSIPWTGWPNFLGEADGYQFAHQWLTILIQHAQPQGVQISLINSANNRHQLKYFREIFHRTPALRFTYDVGNSNVGVSQSLTRDTLFALGDRLQLVHMSDNDGSAVQHLPFGAPAQGGIDLDHELRTLRTFRFDGDITLQMPGDRSWLLAARDRLRAAWTRAG